MPLWLKLLSGEHLNRASLFFSVIAPEDNFHVFVEPAAHERPAGRRRRRGGRLPRRVVPLGHPQRDFFTPSSAKEVDQVGNHQMDLRREQLVTISH